jgi:hypothetical protein
MSQQQRRTLQQLTTTLPPAEVLEAAKRFFARRNGIYAAFLEKEGPTYVAMRGQGGEEVLIGALPKDGLTEVTGSTYLFDQQVARFLASLPTQGPAQGADVGVVEAGGVVADGAPS